MCVRDSQCSSNIDGRNTCYRGRCVECMDSDDDCQSQSLPFCSPDTKKCVQCTEDSHCPNGVCSMDKTCVECVSNRQCAGRGSYLEFVCSLYASPSAYRYTCGECSVSSDCPYQMTCGDGRKCTCTSNSQCGGDSPVCFEGRCQGCPGDNELGDTFCSNNGMGTNCTIVNGTEHYQCTQCTDSSTCPFGMQCVNSTCICTKNSQCVGPDNQLANICNPLSNRCVQCLDSTDCKDPMKPFCVKGICEECTGLDSTCTKKQVTGNVQCSDYGMCLPYCRNDDDCTQTERPYCHKKSSTCTVCRDDLDCPGNGVCYSGKNGTEPTRCVECKDDSMCSKGSLCNPRTNMCSTCTEHSDCPVELPICSDRHRTCTQCDENSDNCPDFAPICHEGMCRACISDTDCPASMHCSSEYQCEICLEDRHCSQIFGSSTKPFCSPESYTCGSCRDDQDCPSQFPLCSKLRNSKVCTQCDGTHPCKYGHVCSEEGICVECSSQGSVDRGCPPNRPFCSANSRCVSCLSSSDCTNPTESCFDGLCQECDGAGACSRIVETLTTTCTKELTCRGSYYRQT